MCFLVSSHGFEPLESLTQLRDLDLFEQVIEDDSVSILRNHTNLTALSFKDASAITSKGIECLSQMVQLGQLSLAGTAVDSIASLTGLQSLREFSVDETKLTDEGISHITKLTSLHYLTLGKCKKRELK